MQSSKAVQLPATSGCVVHALLWKPAMELLKKSSGHFFKAWTGTTALLLLRAVLLGGCRGLLPAPRAAGVERQCPSAQCSVTCPGVAGLGGDRALREPCAWRKDAAWLTETPKARVFVGQDYFSPVVWFVFIPRSDDFFPSLFDLQFHCALETDQSKKWPFFCSNMETCYWLYSCDSWPLCGLFRQSFTHSFSIPIVYLFLENLKGGLWGPHGENYN